MADSDLIIPSETAAARNGRAPEPGYPVAPEAAVADPDGGAELEPGAPADGGGDIGARGAWYRDPAYLGGIVAGAGIILLLASRWNKLRQTNPAEAGAVRPCKCCGQLVQFDGERWAAIDQAHHRPQPADAKDPQPVAPTQTWAPAEPQPGDPVEIPPWESDPAAALAQLHDLVGVATPMEPPANLADAEPTTDAG